MAQIVGGCLCGKVRYSANAEPMFTGACHCKTCQKESGSAFNIVVAVPQSALSIQGSPKTYARSGDSGQQVVHRFCPDCGSTITSEPAAMPGASIIRAGTLDDTSWLQPAMEIYCDNAQPWVKLAGERQRFPGMPQRPG
ncbi:MAG: GFA family protein [Alphaproteobacteria bacterium]|nr:GFA family protein [Alphaproteobacteria bacterium]MBV9016852.1 GFA family protein [Alphaproteobacteria bacterium]MBV9153751.1 GFA family protein [Alphaproteobacteria bacterium]MBV9583686.1 GFA family protein [Alphaproteobacteria bacterium]